MKAAGVIASVRAKADHKPEAQAKARLRLRLRFRLALQASSEVTRSFGEMASGRGGTAACKPASRWRRSRRCAATAGAAGAPRRGRCRRRRWSRAIGRWERRRRNGLQGEQTLPSALGLATVQEGRNDE